jgi:hypothetical protein
MIVGEDESGVLPFRYNHGYRSSYITWGMKNSPVGDRSSDKLSSLSHSSVTFDLLIASRFEICESLISDVCYK